MKAAESEPVRLTRRVCLRLSSEQWRTHTFVCWRPPDSSNVPESVDHVAKCHLKPLLTSHHDCSVVVVVLKKKKNYHDFS